MSAETWLPVPGYEGFYTVSDHGRVFSVPRITHGAKVVKRVGGAFLAQARMSGGYGRVSLYKHGKKKLFFAHTLVLTAHVSPRPSGLFGCHKDGNPSNNRLDNLRWATPSENTQDMFAHGTAYTGERHWKTKLTNSDVSEIFARLGAGETGLDIATRFGVTPSCVSAIKTGRSWAHRDVMK